MKPVYVIMPAYNAETTIEKSIDAIINQTYKNWELHIVDDCSTDGTIEIIHKKYEEVFPKIVVHHQAKNSGVSKARNTALNWIGTNTIVAYCDADDVWEPYHLQIAVELLDAGADLVYSNPIIVGEKGEPLTPTFPLYDHFDRNNFKNGNFIFISTVVHKNFIPNFDSEVDSLEDYDMWLLASKFNLKFVQHANPTVTYLVKQGGMAGKGSSVLSKVKEKHKDFFMNDVVKLHLGCGDQYLDGYVNCDLYAEKVDKRCDVAVLPYPDNCASEILASHIIEHFSFKQGFDVLREWYRVLQPGGKIRIETPDLLNTCRRFVDGDEQVRINLYGHFFAWPWQPGQAHLFLYTETQMKWTLSEIGFKNIERKEPISIYYNHGQHPADLYLYVEAEK